MASDELTEIRFRRYSIAVGDFEEAVEAAEEALRHPPDSPAREALFFMAIILYVRPFSANEKRPKKGEIPPSELCVTLDDFLPLLSEEVAVHQACELLRNRVLAHAEHSFYPSRVDPRTGVMSRQRPSLMSPIVDDAGVLWPFDIRLFCSLASKLADQCHHKRADYAHHLRA